MLERDPTSEVVGALRAYFSEPIAKGLLTSTLRRARLSDGELDGAHLGPAIHALERALPMYIADKRRRDECIARLRQLAPADGADAPPREAAAQASTTIRVESTEDVTNAREAGRDIARQAGFNALEQTKIATAISELARNILQYAGRGHVEMTVLDEAPAGIQIRALDRGPGIPDVGLVMSDAYRSRTGLGMGLKGTKRLMDVFEIDSVVGQGTTVLARKYLR